MEENECPYNKGNAPISSNSVRGQEDCWMMNCLTRGDFYKCYYKNCRIPKIEEGK